MNLSLLIACLGVALASTAEFSQRKATVEEAARLLRSPISKDAMSVGTTFIYSYLNSHLTPNDTSYSENLFLTITNTAVTTANVKLSSAFPLFTNVTYTVPASSSKTFAITPPDIQTDYQDLQLQTLFKGNKAIWVNSDQPISLVATNQLNDGSSEDKFAIIPICQLGTHYLAVNDESARKIGPMATNLITVIAPQDNTQVTLLTQDFLLNAGEQLTIATYFSASAIPVQASAPVAVISGAVCGFGYTNQAHCSHESLMLYPVSMWDSTLPFFKFLPEDYGEVMLFAEYDNTTLFLDGVNMGMFDSSSFYILRINNGVQIAASSPVYAAAVGSSNIADQGSPFFVHVVPPKLFTSQAVQFATALNSDEAQNMVHFVRIITFIDSIGKVAIDGYYPNGLIYRRMGKGNYYFVDVSISPGQHFVSSSTTTVQYGVVVYGYGKYKSYGFNAGLNLPSNGVC